MSTRSGDYLSSGPRFAEGDVIERIESFRRRRPRLLDDHVTLAHGAGGKASAALVDAVFVEAFRNPLLESLGDGAVLTLPSGERVAIYDLTVTGVPELTAIVAGVIGGIGYFPGALLGAFILALLQQLVVWQFNSAWQSGIVFFALILFLIVRPQGVFGGRMIQRRA